MIDPSILTKQVQNSNPRVMERSGHSSNEVFPYRFWQSFSLTDWDFAVELSVDCKNVSGGFELSSDITTSDGLILAEFETNFIDQALSENAKRIQIASWIERLNAFLVSQAPVIVDRLQNAKAKE